MATGTLKVGTCQFEVSASVEQNFGWITRLMRKAKERGAELVHFSEAALSGYGGANIESFAGYDWDGLRRRTIEIMELARELRVWVVLGSTHPLSGKNKPHNCLYVITPEGKILDRYDKRFCTLGDLDYYSPGSRFVFFTINGVKCTVLICFDLRFPELYRELRRYEADCIFQSFYNAGTGKNVHTHIMRQTMQCHAATNKFWVSMANTSGPRSPYPSCFIQPDGVILKQLKLNKPGVMVNTVDMTMNFYDPSAPFRNAAIAGALSNGPEVTDPRSAKTDEL